MCSTPAVADRPISTHVIEFPYTRTLGPVVGPFLTGLRDGTIRGIRSRDGRVLVPPTEWDPSTGESLDPTDLVDVGPGGVVESWAWVTQPTGKHPLQTPFAFALVKLDGADTAMAHVVRDGLDRLRVGSRVEAVWRPDDERVGSIRDIACFRLVG
jgi:hypothetical protein